MSPTKLRKPIKTYSRLRKPAIAPDAPATKRRRLNCDSENAITRNNEASSSPNSPTKSDPIIPTSTPDDAPAISSDAPVESSPPSSPSPVQSSPPPQRRKSIFSYFKRQSETKQTTSEPLSERNSNVPPPSQPVLKKKKRLTQMQLDLGGDNRRTCKVCKMEYIPSNSEDAALHKKFHAKNVGGIDIGKAILARLRENEVWTGGDGSFVAVVGRKDPSSLRNKAVEVLDVVNAELAAVEIPADTLWSQNAELEKENRRIQEDAEGSSSSAKRTTPSGDRFKMYLYIRGQKCVGACLAERITEAFLVLGSEDSNDGKGEAPSDHHSSSISMSDTAEEALLGISRIWTSNLHRKEGIATALLESARSDFLYGMRIAKEKVAFSQPTESGGRLARKWFDKASGWHVYVD